MDENIMSNLDKDYFATEKCALKCLGLGNQNTSQKICVIVTLCLMTVYLALAFPELFNLKDDFDEFINNLLFLSGCTIGLLKYTFLFVNNSKIRAVLGVLQEGIFLPSPERGGEIGRKLLINCINFTRKQSIACVWMGVADIAIIATTSYIFQENDHKRKLPFGLFPSFNWPFYYEIAFCCQTAVYTVACIAFLLEDLIYANILIHASVHCKNVQYCIKNLVENSFNHMTKQENCDSNAIFNPNGQSTPEIVPSKVPWEYLKQKLNKAIQYHQAVIDLTEEVEKLFSVITLISTVLTTFLLCFIMYHASSLSMLEITFWKDVAMLGTLIFVLFMLSYWADNLMEASQGVANACYETNFVGSDIRFQKSLITVMQRSQKPITFTIGKFGNLSMVAMLAIFRASYSYFMFLRRVNNQQ